MQSIVAFLCASLARLTTTLHLYVAQQQNNEEKAEQKHADRQH